MWKCGGPDIRGRPATSSSHAFDHGSLNRLRFGSPHLPARVHLQSAAQPRLWGRRAPEQRGAGLEPRDVMRRPGRAGPASSSLPSRAEGSSSRAGPREKSACWSRAPCCALYGRAEAVAAHMQFLAPSGPRKRLRASSRRHVRRSGRFASGFRRLLNPVAHDHSAGISACVTGLVRSRYVSEGMVARPRAPQANGFAWPRRPSRGLCPARAGAGLLPEVPLRYGRT